jgi:DNA ligase (NAD+)
MRLVLQNISVPYAGFKRVNEAREREGEPLFANPRNAAAGGLRQLDPALTRKRRLRLFAFAVDPIEGTLPARTHSEVLDLLDAWGFQVEPHRERFETLDGVQQKVAAFEQLLPHLPFQADGIVIKVDPLRLHAELGVVGGREPRWAIARKFAPEIAVTRVHRIEINVVRTGALNPWASLEPVQITGVTVSAATLHYEDLIAVCCPLCGSVPPNVRCAAASSGCRGPGCGSMRRRQISRPQA